MPLRDTAMPRAPHIPVLLTPLLQAVAPVRGTWIDGTFGAGGYARGLLDAGADHVIGIDRDPLALQMAADWAQVYGDRLTLVAGNFSHLDALAGKMVDGIVLDLGVSSMQIDLAERGFSFQKDGPLDMRMSQDGLSAADLVNDTDEAALPTSFTSMAKNMPRGALPAPSSLPGIWPRSPRPCNWPKSSRAACHAPNRGKAIPQPAVFKPCALR